MILVFLIEFVLLVLGVTLFITQLLMPWLQGRPAFPLFRRSARLEAKFRKAGERYDNEVRQHEIDREKLEASLLRKGQSGQNR